MSEQPTNRPTPRTAIRNVATAPSSGRRRSLRNTPAAAAARNRANQSADEQLEDPDAQQDSKNDGGFFEKKLKIFFCSHDTASCYSRIDSCASDTNAC